MNRRPRLTLLLFVLMMALVSCAKERPVPAPAKTLFPVLVNGKWGYIDPAGAVVIQPQFDGAQRFSEGLAAVAVNGKQGYIDSTGQMIIEPQFLFARPFANGCACVIKHAGRFGYINREERLLIAYLGNPAGVGWRVNANNMPVIATEPDPDQPSDLDFSENVAPVWVKGLWGYMDTNGKVVIPPLFASAKRFSEGLAAVAVGTGPRDQSWGYIDHNGKFVLPILFGNANDFSEGRASVYFKNNWIFIDSSGTVTSQPLMEFGPYQDGLAYNELWGGTGVFLDPTGKVACQTAARLRRGWHLSEGLVPVEVSHMIPSPQGNWMVPDIHWGYMDATCQIAIEPQYSKTEPFRDGLGRVWQGDKMGYIDKTGKIIWPLSN